MSKSENTEPALAEAAQQAMQQVRDAATIAERQRNVNILTDIFAYSGSREVALAISLISGQTQSPTYLRAALQAQDDARLSALTAQYEEKTGGA